MCDVTGYSNPDESDYDIFKVGHTSTSISLSCGLVKARDLKNEKYNVVAVIGDGSLSGGEALEGLDFAGEQNSNFIIIVNDNGMSIAENHGGLYKNLKELRESKENHSIVITLEDGMINGGFGEKIASFYGDSKIYVKNYGIEKSFPDRYDVNRLLKENRLTKEQIVGDIEKLL